MHDAAANPPATDSLAHDAPRTTAPDAAPRTGRRATGRRGLALLASGTTVAVVSTMAASAVGAQDSTDPYVGSVEVVRDIGARSDVDARMTSDDDTLRGRVFEDLDGDSRSDLDEPGLSGITISNGREVAVTRSDGSYELPVRDNMTVFITKPAGYETPVDDHFFPQFFYHHIPAGSPELRFEGLPPSGSIPTSVNFPLREAENEDDVFDCAIIGDTQTYSNREIGYLRDGVVEDMAARETLGECGALLLGDLMGDDLGLYPRFKAVMGQAGVPIRAVPGNHDLDFDAETDAHSTDTYRREIGPSYYSYDIGNVHFVGLDNVKYPCTPEDNPDGDRDFCDDPTDHPDYNGVIGSEQMTWLERDLARVPEDRLVVIATHIPLVSYIDSQQTKHQTDDVDELYALLEGRPALALSGHTHTMENMSTGTSFAGWADTVGVDEIPFPHVVAGAGAGAWWGGDLDADGIPMAFARNGTPGGYSVFTFDDDDWTSTYDATSLDDDQTMGLAVNSPRFRVWAEALRDWARSGPELEDVPPVNLNDLGDPNVVEVDELDGAWLTANVYNGTRETEVTVSINGGTPLPMEITQPGEGEDILEGLDFADPFAMTRQHQVMRHSLRSTSGDERAQGYERFRGSPFGPSWTRPEDLGTDQSPHLWRWDMPLDLPVGVHTAEITSNDVRSGTNTQVLTFEVVEELPPTFYRSEVFEDDEDEG